MDLHLFFGSSASRCAYAACSDHDDASQLRSWQALFMVFLKSPWLFAAGACVGIRWVL
jgi:hypothetical protein